MSLNKITLIGNVGTDPRINSTNDGNEIANFTIATTETWKDKSSGEKNTRTEWHKIVVFGSIVTVVKNFVKKGSKLYLEGKLQTRSYKDKDGNEKYITEIVIQGFNSKLLLLDSKPKLNQQDEQVFNDMENNF